MTDRSEQEERSKELVILHTCRPNNKPTTWMEAVRLMLGDITQYTTDKGRLQTAVHNQPMISPNFNNNVETAYIEPGKLRLGEINHVTLMQLATYARWDMHGRMVSVLWAPEDALGARDMRQWVTRWAEMGCPNESLGMTLLGQSDLRMACSGSLQVPDQSIKANQWRTQEVRNAECYYVSEIMRRNENSRSGQVLRAGLSYKIR
jgi:hypothetical protein